MATGAIQMASADTVNVVVDANQFITVSGIWKSDGSSTKNETDSEGNTYRATPMDPNFPGVAEPEYYSMNMTVQDPDMDNRLMQVAVCLFDKNVINTPDDTNCGNGFDNPENYSTSTTDRNYRPPFRIPGANPPPQSDATTGVFAPESLIQMSFIPGLWEQLSNQGETDNSINVVRPNYSGSNPTHHIVGQTTYWDRNQSSNPQFSAARAYDTDAGDGKDGPYEYEIDFHFAPLIAANNSDNWKIRVVAEYADGTLIELIADQQHEMQYAGGFTEYEEAGFPATAAERGVIDYGEVVAGGSAVSEEISTGSYLTNAVSDITLSATRFKLSSDTTLLDFHEGATLGVGNEGKVSLGCRPTSSSDPLEFFAEPPTEGADAKSSFKLLPEVAANSQPTGNADPRDPLTAETHDCTLTAGSDVPTGEYANQVTVGIGKATAD